MKKLFLFFAMAVAIAIGSSVGLFALTQNRKGADMACCTIADLQAACGGDRIGAWSRLDPDTVDRAIADAGAEIDGYLFSGGYTVPLPGAPANIKKYAVDIASASLVLSAGMLEADPGGKAVYEQAKIARQYLTKVAEGKFAIPGYSAGGEVSKPPSGNVRTRSAGKLDWRGY
jgi:phage gp36-like protein